MAHITQEESMRGLFYIVKGQYSKTEPVVYIEGEAKHIGGYDPENPNTAEWYRVQDNVVHHCFSCGSDLDKCVEAITKMIKHHKTRKSYFRYVCRVTSEDYYETHYLGHEPLTPEKRAKKAEGRCPRVSPAQKRLEDAVFNEYGDYYSDLIEEAEETAYRAIKEDKPLNKAMKRHKKLTKSVSVPEEETPVETPQETQKPVFNTSGMKLKKVKKLGKK